MEDRHDKKGSNRADDVPDHVIVGVGVHLPLEQSLSIHKLTVFLRHVGHHVGQHHHQHALQVDVLLALPLLESCLE